MRATSQEQPSGAEGQVKTWIFARPVQEEVWFFTITELKRHTLLELSIWQCIPLYDSS